MTAIISWLTERIQVSEGDEVIFQDIKRERKNETAKSIAFALRRLYPDAKRCERKINGKYLTVYKGLSFIDKENVVPRRKCSLEYLKHHIPADASLIPSKEGLTLNLGSSVFVNSNMVLKTIHVLEGEWELSVRGKQVDLQKLGISSIFDPSEQSFLNIISIAKKLELCRGDPLEVGKAPSTRKITEELRDSTTGKDAHTVVRSAACKQVARLGSTSKLCNSCQKMKNTPSVVQIELDEEDSQDISVILGTCFENATDDMKLLLRAQYEALNQPLKARRWDKNIISICLALWVRSPRAYQDLKDSNMLILPSGRHLRRYKNIVNQEAGPQNEMFRWMLKSANDAGITPEGKSGFLIHDETKIQENLVLQMVNGTPKLIGWIDSGSEGNNLRIMQQGNLAEKLATEVIQFYFVGYTGFRFPICHYPTAGVKPAELYVMTWELIARLHDWGFSVNGVIQDGGGANRQFMKLHFGSNPADSKYMARHIVEPAKSIAMCQDFSHNIKKVRNGLIKSGGQQFHTRRLLHQGKFIEWSHWIQAAQWDRETNSRLVHRKVTDSHLFPNPPEKMRNHLAEEMLNDEMLNLMQHYQSIKKDGSYLDGTIKLLQHTSSIIRVFRDQRPLTSPEDSRLIHLQEASGRFQEWHSEVLAKESASLAEKRKMMLSQECRDDMDSHLMSFPEICKSHLEEFPHRRVVPSRFNSDIIENHLCQQRGLHNGNSTNPSYASYCNTVNSIILGQSISSKGRRSNVGLPSAKPLNFFINKPLIKKAKVQ